MEHKIIRLLFLIVSVWCQYGYASIQCNFDNNQCQWKQLSSDVFDWTRLTGPTPTTPTGPDDDHTERDGTGGYMYVEASWPRVQGENAIIRAPDLDTITPAHSEQCFTFWYHMFGINIGTLNVYFTSSQTDVDPSELIWTRSGEKGACWIEAQIPVAVFAPSPTSGYYAFEGVMGNGYFGDIAIDDVAIGTCTSVSVDCDWEKGNCDWDQDRRDDFDWKRKNGASTGSHGDHTMADGNGFYLYASSFHRSDGDRAVLTSPAITVPLPCSPVKQCFRFWLFMDEHSNNELNIYLGDASVPLWSRTSAIGYCWAAAQVELSGTVPGEISVEAVVYSRTVDADIAIDDLSYGDCDPDIPEEPSCSSQTSTATQGTTKATTTTVATTSQPTTVPTTTTDATPTPRPTTTVPPTTTDATTTSQLTTLPPTSTEATTTSRRTTIVPPTTTDATTTVLPTSTDTTTSENQKGSTEVSTFSPVIATTSAEVTTENIAATTEEEATTYINTIDATDEVLTTLRQKTTAFSTTELAPSTEKSTQMTTDSEATTNDNVSTDQSTSYATTETQDQCSQSTAGRRFSIAFPTNREYGKEKNSLHITTLAEFDVTVTITDADGSVNFGSVTYDAALSIDLSPSSRCSGQGLQSCTVTIESDAEISVVGHSSEKVSIESFLAIPVDSLGQEYIVASYQPAQTYASVFTVTAADIDAFVSVEFPDDIRQSRLLKGLPADILFHIGSGETYQVEDIVDLTGTKVTSSAPVSVISGASCANIPSGVEFCDYLVEQMPPVDTWGTTITVASLHGRDDFIIRIIAAEDDTTFTFLGEEVTLQSTEFYEYDVVWQDAFTIMANNPVLVLQYQKSIWTDYRGDPSMLIVPSSRQFPVGTVSFPIASSETNSNYVSIVVGTVDEEGIELDGVILEPSSTFHLSDSVYTVWRTEISNGLHKVKHTDPDVPFSVLVYGHDFYMSYAFPASTNLAPRLCGQTTTSFGRTTVPLRKTTNSSTETPATPFEGTTELLEDCATHSTSGTHFAFAFPSNYDERRGTETSLIFTTSSNEAVTVKVTGQHFSKSLVMTKGDRYEMIIDPIPLSSGSQYQNSTVVVEASGEVTVQGWSEDNITFEEFTPIQRDALGTDYVIISYPPFAPDGYKSQFTITTGEPSATQVEIRFASDYEFGGATHDSNIPLALSLSAYETVQFQSAFDLTGSRVVASEPIAVVSGDSCALVPVGVNFCNYMVEAIPSVDRWGSTFVISSFLGRSNGFVLRILASNDQTDVEITSPIGSILESLTLDAYQTYERDFNSSARNGPWVISASHPVLAVVYQKGFLTDHVGDPSMAVIPAVEQWTSGEVTFDVVDQKSVTAYDHISIAVRAADEAGVLLDGALVAGLANADPARGRTYTVWRIDVEPGYHVVTHQDPSVYFTVLVYGTKTYNSYAYAVKTMLPKNTPVCASGVYMKKIIN